MKKISRNRILKITDKIMKYVFIAACLWLVMLLLSGPFFLEVTYYIMLVIGLTVLVASLIYELLTSKVNK